VPGLAPQLAGRNGQVRHQENSVIRGAGGLHPSIVGELLVPKGGSNDVLNMAWTT
jgi:hypothetical protein